MRCFTELSGGVCVAKPQIGVDRNVEIKYTKKALLFCRAFLLIWVELQMDILKTCAVAFSGLLDVQYNIVLGRKNITTPFSLKFDKSDFHHLAGLQKLKDIEILRSGNREKVFDMILREEITYNQIRQSCYFEEMQDRLVPLSYIEEFLDSNTLIFKYNEKAHNFSAIQAKFLMRNKIDLDDVYLFIDSRDNDECCFCRTFFPHKNIDYSKGQASYTLLRKEKVNLSDGSIQVQYDKLTPKEVNSEHAPIHLNSAVS